VQWFNPGKNYGYLLTDDGTLVFLSGDVIDPRSVFGPLSKAKMPQVGDVYEVKAIGKAVLFSDTEMKPYAKKVRRLRRAK
jgi:uncharacterized protein YfkK (UPF0435 family)